MQNRLAWLTLGITGLLFATPSCGEDEATGNGNPAKAGYCEQCGNSSQCDATNVCMQVSGSLGVCARRTDTRCCDPADATDCHDLTGQTLGSGGSGGSVIGSGGSAGRGGSAGKGGTGGSGVQSNLGKGCTTDASCGDPRLTCMTSDGLDDGSGPPGGLCTLSCTSDGQCLELSDGSFCVDFGSGDSYCLQGCTTGSAGVPKCQDRADFSCSLLGTIPTTQACTSSAECGSGFLCDEGTCGEIVPGCLPTCGGDFDCGSGQYCDFASGWCVPEEPDGLPIGSPCNPTATNDPCNGFCIPVNDAGTEGECAAFCSFAMPSGCGWDGSAEADAACLFGTILSPPGDAAPGDLGICGKLCDCNAECPLENNVCVDEGEQIFTEIWGRNGYCRELQDGESLSSTFRECPDGASGGAGGMSGGDAGSGGSGGSSSGGGGESGEGAGGTSSSGSAGEVSVSGQGGQGGA